MCGVRVSWAGMVEPEKRWRDHGDLAQPEVFELVARHNAALADTVAAAMAMDFDGTGHVRRARFASRLLISSGSLSVQ